MPEKWLQIKGDPSVRAFLFQQCRVESLFDSEIERIHEIIYRLLAHKGAFHVKVHYSSSQLTCWFADDAFRYRVYVKEEVLEPGFIEQFRDMPINHLQPLVEEQDLRPILNEFNRLRTTDQTIYMRNGSINRINGQIGMTYSCDGAHYIDHRTFFEKLDTFATCETDDPPEPLALIA